MIDDAAARRYLLGEANEGERATIEEEYFRNSESSDQVAQVEEELIEDYLAGRLTPQERVKFERVYLATTQHRLRLEAIRRLTRPADARRSRTPAWLALAAAAAIAIALGAVWFLIASHRPAATTASREPASRPDVAQSAPPAATVARIPQPTFAISLSPLNLRGDGGTPTYRVPTAAIASALQLEGDTAGAPVQNPRVAIETIEGRSVWNGAAARDGGEGVLARVEVPAANLSPGDYIVRLSGSDARGREQERGRYFLRLR